MIEYVADEFDDLETGCDGLSSEKLLEDIEWPFNGDGLEMAVLKVVANLCGERNQLRERVELLKYDLTEARRLAETHYQALVQSSKMADRGGSAF